MSKTTTISAALGLGWDRIGKAITDAGMEDSSGFRRQIMDLLMKQDYAQVATALHINKSAAMKLHKEVQEAWAGVPREDAA